MNARRATLSPTESQEQAALVEWAAWQSKQRQELALLYAIPNEAAYKNRRLQANGVKPGVPDLHLLVARANYHGLWIEMKVGCNQPTPEQICWHAALIAAGHCVIVCYTAEEAMAEIMAYLDLKESR